MIDPAIKAELAGGQGDGRLGEDAAGPTAGAARVERGGRVEAGIHGLLSAHHAGILGGFGGVVAAAHHHFDIAKAPFG